MTKMMDFDGIERGAGLSEDMIARGESALGWGLSAEKKAYLDGAFDAFLEVLDAGQLAEFCRTIDEYASAAHRHLLAKRACALSSGSLEPLPVHMFAVDAAYQIKATIVGIRPTIWRRFVIQGRIDFASLHETLLTLFNWSGEHHYMFEFGMHLMCESLQDKAVEKRGGYDEPHIKGAENYQLGELLREGMVFRYWYDFSDDWCVKVDVEKVFPAYLIPNFPYCLHAARNAPPEDVGGVKGYQEFLQVISNPADDRYVAMMNWFAQAHGGSFDPEAVKIGAINQVLRAIEGRGIASFE